MAAPSLPNSMSAWQYSDTSAGFSKSLKLNPSVVLPQPTPDQHLVQIIAVSINPADYKPSEQPLINRFMIPKPATPGIDFAGRVITPAEGSYLKPGQLVFGMTGNYQFAGGALREFAVADKSTTAPLPDGTSALHASTIGIAGITAYQTIVPRLKRGDRVFINGGSGGTGAFGIQLAKAIGCHVTTTCGTSNVEFCKSIGADEVIDYRKGSLLEALKTSGHKFDHVVDNVGADNELYFKCHEYTNSDAVYVMVAGAPAVSHIATVMYKKLWPRLLGGGKRAFEDYLLTAKYEEFVQVSAWMKEGKVKAVIDQIFPFEQTPEAFEKLETGRARGKIVIEVTPETRSNV